MHAHLGTNRRLAMILVLASGGYFFFAGIAAEEEKGLPRLPDSKWTVHDMARPQPAVVTPGASPADPPSDAVVLFDGKDLSKWNGDGGKPAAWKVENGYMEINATGSISTKEEFGDCQLHIEWMAPVPPHGESQGRGNSGVYLQSRYEVQVLDSYQNKTYADGSAGSLYGQHPPLVNACRKPGEWQSYDIIYRAPRFLDGKVREPGRMTILHNGVLVQSEAGILGSTVHGDIAKYGAHGPAPLALQDHGDKQPVRFRNIWIRKLELSEELLK
jgi:3-keto-disaccharide hydrolase